MKKRPPEYVFICGTRRIGWTVFVHMTDEVYTSGAPWIRKSRAVRCARRIADRLGIPVEIEK